ncbi:MAG TPA: lamin tail domain-containing protein, partial [Thermoleophilaceae bacterium]|nr:lamin tail domain-containing protein [Thermoleophilaceae bacterium]
MASPHRRLALLVTLAALFTAAPASAASPDLVISQVYGGGGNSGATLRNDYIELFNRGTAPVDVSGWSVQYASATGTTWQSTSLSGTVDPGHYLLVKEAAGAGGTTDLPAADASGSIAMSATSGKVRLFSAAGVVDLVGYGSSATTFEGSGPTPTLSNTTAAFRKDGGCTDTDDNAGDFTTAPPDPRNSSSAAKDCSAPPPPPPPTVAIHDIQGAGHTSPHAGETVTTTGIVTAKRSNGFYLQDPAGDGDDATSEGIFVFTSSAPTVAIGDGLSLEGTVQEFRPGGAGTANLTTTEIAGPSITVVSSGNPLPAPVVIGPGGRVPPPQVIEDDGFASFDSGADGIDFYESLEGQRVEVDDAVAVGPTADFGSNREIPVLADNGADAGVRTARGGIVVRQDDFNPERIILNDLIAGGPKLPPVNVADSFPGATVGVIDYSFGNYKLEVASLPDRAQGGLQRETTAAPGVGQLAVATFNVENLDPKDPPEKFAALAKVIVDNMRAPDLISVEEVQDDNGAANDSVVSAEETWSRLTDAIAAAGGPHYEHRQIDPVDDQDGGEPGGNIRVGFLFRTDRGLGFVDRPGGGSTTPVAVEEGSDGPQLSVSPGRIEPANSAFKNSRKPLAGEFTYDGHRLFAVANHWNSKGGDDPLYGRFQPPARSSETQRNQQAQLVHDFAADVLAADPDARVLVLGDLNDFEFSSALGTLKGSPAILDDLAAGLPQDERYSYVFEGNSQTLDHVVVSHSVSSALRAFDVVHVNSEFADQTSDHEPLVARVCADATAPSLSVSASPSVLTKPNHK